MATDWKQRVITYYEKTLWDYILAYFRGDDYSMNYGYWDETVKTRKESYARLYERIADALSLKPGDRLLDAGCGLGEAACFFAHYGCRVMGLTISPTQVVKAQKIIEERRLGDQVNIALADYTSTSFSDGSFDAICAIETICHLSEKEDFYKEAYRLLTPGGKLAVAEFVQLKKPTSRLDRRTMEVFLDGWAIANLWTSNGHRDALRKRGFTDIQIEDYSDKTVRVARYLYGYSLLGIPVYRLLRALRLIDDARMNDATSCRYQWLTKQRGLWGHGLIVARKP